jgi:hypothetical protein
MLAGHRRRSITMRPARSWRRASPGRLGYRTSVVRGFATYLCTLDPVTEVPRLGCCHAVATARCPTCTPMPTSRRYGHHGDTAIVHRSSRWDTGIGERRGAAQCVAALPALGRARYKKTDRSWECPASGRCAHSGPQQHTITQARRVNGRLQLTGGPCAEILGEEDDILSAQQIYADPDHRCSKIVASLV